ncbi:pseudouridine synthase [Bacteroidota bacterium]
MKQRVQKIIAASGFASRRKAEELIISGKVMVNGKEITIGDQADLEKDKVTVSGQEIKIDNHVYIMVHKPTGFISTRSDPYDRRSVMELIQGISKPIYPVGRLDTNARGLLLMTSDGDFSQKILHPSNETTKTYVAILNRPMDRDIIDVVKRGVLVDGRPVKANLKKIGPKKAELRIHEGRNKIVKRFFRAMGYYVDDLKRVAIGSLKLEKLQEGKWRHLTKKEIETLTYSSKK